MNRLTLPAKKLVWLVLFALGIGLTLVPLRSAGADWNDPAVQYGYATTRDDPPPFEAVDGNKRLHLKKLAEIEKASAATIHYDATVKSNYMCDWVYDKVLGRDVCEKNYLKAYQYTHPKPIPVCPFGYKLNYGGSGCVPIRYPQNAHLNARGDGWECNPGYHLNLTGSVCLGPEHVSRPCPNGSAGCNSGCQGSSCAQPCAVQPIVMATPVFVQPLVVQIQQAAPSRPPYSLPATGPSFLGLLLGLSALGAKRFLKKK